MATTYKLEQIKLLYTVLLESHGMVDDTNSAKRLGEQLSKFESGSSFGISINDTYLETNFRKKIRSFEKEGKSKIGFNKDYVEKIARFVGFSSYQFYLAVLNEADLYIRDIIEEDFDTDISILSSDKGSLEKLEISIQKFSFSVQDITPYKIEDWIANETLQSKCNIVLINTKDVLDRIRQLSREEEIDFFPIKGAENIKLEWPDLRHWMNCNSKLQHILFPMLLDKVLNKQLEKAEEEKTENQTMIVNGGLGNQGTVTIEGKYIVNAPSSFNINET